ncbi:MAG: 4-hydroxy-tetrahydrodipicolinate synthase [Alphaproteobacteria bacterium]
MLCRGSLVALVTPFADDGKVDTSAFEIFCDWQIAEGTDGLVPVGTTGESPTLSKAEKATVIDIAVRTANGRVPVIAGTGGNNTAEVIDASRAAQKQGVDGLMVVVPPYNKPSQEGMFQHYQAVHDATDLPILIYNIPGRSGVDMSVETMSRLAELPRIVGVKDATGDLVRPLETRIACGPEFCQLSGEDATVTGFYAQGGHGCISVTANVAPALCAALHDAQAAGDMPRVAHLRDLLMPLHAAVFSDSSPGPAKWALHRLGLMRPDLRLPMVAPSDTAKRQIEGVITALSLSGEMNNLRIAEAEAGHGC